MTEIEAAAWIQATAAVATFLAACCAVWATFDGPKRAAELAEKLRRKNQQIDAQLLEKHQILKTLMTYRGVMISQEAVNALNLIDVAFVDAPEVREAYQQFWNSTAEQTAWELKVERYNAIIERIVRHLGTSDLIKTSDIQRTYHPDLHAKLNQVQMAELDLRWAELFNEDGSPKMPR